MQKKFSTAEDRCSRCGRRLGTSSSARPSDKKSKGRNLLLGEQVMRKVIISSLAINLVAAIALAQIPPAPPAPPTSAAPQAPAAPKAPKPPKPPRAEWSRGSYLGVDSREVTPERMGSLKLKNDQGV